MKKLIVYDLDGTLVDTLDDITTAANLMLTEMGARTISKLEVRGCVGRGLQELVNECLGGEQDSKRLAEGMKIYRRHYSKHMLDHSQPYPGAMQVLEHFRSRVQAVITNKPDPYATQMIEALKLAPFFSAIIPGGGAFPKKPNPASLQSLLTLHNVRADDAVFIGDSVVDIQTARGAGVMNATVSHGLEDLEALQAARPDRLFPHFSALLACAKLEKW